MWRLGDLKLLPAWHSNKKLIFIMIASKLIHAISVIVLHRIHQGKKKRENEVLPDLLG